MVAKRDEDFEQTRRVIAQRNADEEIDLRGLSDAERDEVLRGIEPVKRNKYGAVKVKEDGYVFDSKMEYHRYLILRDMAERGEITHLTVHGPKFQLVGKQAYGGRKWRAITYEPDYSYIEVETNKRVYEDCKGHETALWRLKWSLLIWEHRDNKEVEFRVVKMGRK